MELNSTFSKINAIARRYINEHGTAAQGPDVEPWHRYFQNDAQRVMNATTMPLSNETAELNRVAQHEAAKEQLNRHSSNLPVEYYGPDTSDPTDPANYPVLSAFESGQFNSANATYESVAQLQDELVSQTSALSRKPRQTQHILANHRIASALYVRKALLDVAQREPTQASNPIFPVGNTEVGKPTNEPKTEPPTYADAIRPLNPVGTGLRDNPDYSIKRVKPNVIPTYDSDTEDAQDPMAGTVFAGKKPKNDSTLPQIPTPPIHIKPPDAEPIGDINEIKRELKESKAKLGNFFDRSGSRNKTNTEDWSPNANRSKLKIKSKKAPSVVSLDSDDDVQEISPPKPSTKSRLSRSGDNDVTEIKIDTRSASRQRPPSSPLLVDSTPPPSPTTVLPKSTLGITPALSLENTAVVNKKLLDKVAPKLRETIAEANIKARQSSTDPLNLHQKSSRSFGKTGDAVVKTVPVPTPTPRVPTPPVRIETPEDFDRNLTPILGELAKTSAGIVNALKTGAPGTKQANDVYRFKQAQVTKPDDRIKDHPQLPTGYADEDFEGDAGGGFEDGGVDYNSDYEFVPIEIPRHPPLNSNANSQRSASAPIQPKPQVTSQPVIQSAPQENTQLSDAELADLRQYGSKNDDLKDLRLRGGAAAEFVKLTEQYNKLAKDYHLPSVDAFKQKIPTSKTGGITEASVAYMQRRIEHLKEKIGKIQESRKAEISKALEEARSAYSSLLLQHPNFPTLTELASKYNKLGYSSGTEQEAGFYRQALLDAQNQVEKDKSKKSKVPAPTPASVPAQQPPPQPEVSAPISNPVTSKAVIVPIPDKFNESNEPYPVLDASKDYKFSSQDPLTQARRRRSKLAKANGVISPEGLHRGIIDPSLTVFPNLADTNRYLANVITANKEASKQGLKGRYLGVRKVQDALARQFNTRQPSTNLVPSKENIEKAVRFPGEGLTFAWFLPTPSVARDEDFATIKHILDNQSDSEDTARKIYLHASENIRGGAALKNYLQNRAEELVKNAYAHSYLVGNDIATKSASSYLKEHPNDRSKALGVLNGFLDYHRLSRILQVLHGLDPTPFKSD